MRRDQLRALLRELADAPNLTGTNGTVRAGDRALFASGGRLYARLSATQVEPVTVEDEDDEEQPHAGT